MSESLDDTADLLLERPILADNRAGDILAGRFKIREAVVNSPYGSIYAAADLTTANWF